MKIGIIGGGLAGCASAYVLAREGHEVTIYDAGQTLAGKASGNPYGLYNPRLAAEITPESHYYRFGYDSILALLKEAGSALDYQQCGALHLMSDEKREKRFRKAAGSWGWSEERLKILSPKQASEIAGVEVKHEALFLLEAGVINPKSLCTFYASGISVITSSALERVDDLDEEIVIIAAGTGSAAYQESRFIPIKPVRGQVTVLKETQGLKGLQANLCYGGYCTPALEVDGEKANIIGATFQRWLDHDNVLAEDDTRNLEQLSEIMGMALNEAYVIASRASVRATLPDHFPVCGKLSDNVYISAAHGSHGIISALASAHHIADLIADCPPRIGEETAARLSPQRFLTIRTQ